MNRGCFGVAFLEVLIFFPFVPNTVEYGSFGLACGEGCFSPNATLVPSGVSGQPAGASGQHDRTRALSALGAQDLVADAKA